MKKLYILSFYFILVFQLSAQIQKGLVRTVGTSTEQSKPIENATIKIKGNTNYTVSDHVGKFSLTMTGKEEGEAFQLLNVIKKGYEFADKDFLSNKFAYSSKINLEIVMISSAELIKTKQEIENRIYKEAQGSFKKKIKKLEVECDSGFITIESYKEKYQSLMDLYDNFEAVISDMADHYARTDYDKLDSIDAVINTCIKEGDLIRADSLIKQKGNIDERLANYKSHIETNSEARTVLTKLEEEVAKERALYEKERDDISNDLYHKHTIALTYFDYEEALSFLKLRADLDTTNVSAVGDYIFLCYKQKKFTECEKYCNMTISHLLKAPNDYRSVLTKIQNMLGVIYDDLHEYSKSKIYLFLALENAKQLFELSPDLYRADLADIQHNIGRLYNDTKDLQNSEKYYIFALKNREQLLLQNPDTYRLDLAGTQNNLGILYENLNDYVKSEQYYLLALDNYEQLFAQNPDLYREEIASVQDNLGIFYNLLHDYSKSEKYKKLALNNYEQLFAKNPDAYRADLASVQHNFGKLYNDLNNLQNSLYYYNLALENRENLLLHNLDAYRFDLAATQNNLGVLYDNIHDYSNSEKYYTLALENYEKLFDQNPDSYRFYLASTQNNLGNLYRVLHNNEKSEKFYRLSLDNRQKLCAQNSNAYLADLADTEYNLGLLYSDFLDYRNSEKYFKLALEKFELLFSLNSDAYQPHLVDTRNNLAISLSYTKKFKEAINLMNNTINMFPEIDYLYDTKGEILLMQGKNTEALEMWKKIMILNPYFLIDYPEGTNLFNGLKKLGLIQNL